MAKVIHMMIRVLDEARSVKFYDEAFGLKVADRYPFETFTLVYLSNADAPYELELTINHGRTEPYDLGTGYGHIAVAVEDLDAEHQRLFAAGVMITPIKELRHEAGLAERFFFVEDPDGYKIEVLQRQGRYR